MPDAAENVANREEQRRSGVAYQHRERARDRRTCRHRGTTPIAPIATISDGVFLGREQDEGGNEPDGPNAAVHEEQPHPRPAEPVRRLHDVGLAGRDIGPREPIEGELADVVAGFPAVVEVTDDLPGRRAHQESVSGVAGGNEQALDLGGAIEIWLRSGVISYRPAHPVLMPYPRTAGARVSAISPRPSSQSLELELEVEASGFVWVRPAEQQALALWVE